MTIKNSDFLQSQLFKVLSQLSLSEQEQVLKFATSLQKKKRFQDWDTISDQEAAIIKAEFADEDLRLAQAVLTDYFHQLEQEDIR